MNAPKISAIVSTYRSAEFIEGCLANLMEQTARQDLEVIVIDSASPQNEAGIVRRFQARYPRIIRYVRTARRETQYASWNRAIRLARGRYVTTANADDRSRSDAYERMSRVLDLEKGVALVYSDYYLTRKKNDSFHLPGGRHRRLCRLPEYSPKNLLVHNMIGPRPMYRRSTHRRIGYFNPAYACVGDYDFWLRMSRSYSMKRVPEALALFYLNPKGLYWGSLERRKREARKACLAFFGKAKSC